MPLDIITQAFGIPHLQPDGPMTPCAVSSADALAFSSSTMMSSTFKRLSRLRSEPKLCAAVASRPRTILHSKRTGLCTSLVHEAW